jgi:hypothetical protein
MDRPSEAARDERIMPRNLSRQRSPIAPPDASSRSVPIAAESAVKTAAKRRKTTTSIPLAPLPEAIPLAREHAIAGAKPTDFQRLPVSQAANTTVPVAIDRISATSPTPEKSRCSGAMSTTGTPTMLQADLSAKEQYTGIDHSTANPYDPRAKQAYNRTWSQDDEDNLVADSYGQDGHSYSPRPAGDMHNGFLDNDEIDIPELELEIPGHDHCPTIQQISDEPPLDDGLTDERPPNRIPLRFNLDEEDELIAAGNMFQYGILPVLSECEIISIALYQIKTRCNVALDTHLEYLQVVRSLLKYRILDPRTVETTLERITGIKHERYDVCRNGCLCFAKPEYVEMTECPMCGEARRDGNCKFCKNPGMIGDEKLITHCSCCLSDI